MPSQIHQFWSLVLFPSLYVSSLGEDLWPSSPQNTSIPLVMSGCSIQVPSQSRNTSALQSCPVLGPVATIQQESPSHNTFSMVKPGYTENAVAWLCMRVQVFVVMHAHASDANVRFWTTVWTWTYQNWTQVWAKVQRNYWTKPKVQVKVQRMDDGTEPVQTQFEPNLLGRQGGQSLS